VEGIDLWGFIPRPHCGKICTCREYSQTLGAIAGTSEQDYCLQGCEAIKSDREAWVFQRNLVPTSSRQNSKVLIEDLVEI
jgi:hypothetical protein